jgi:pyruvate dehydrogenase E1 component beta subunit
LRSAILDDDDPLLFIEHKLLYPASVLAMSGIEEFLAERSGTIYPTYRLRVDGAPDPVLTMATYGHMGGLARTAALKLAYEHEIFAEVLIFTQLSPVPGEALLESLTRTSRLLTVEEACAASGWGAELVALSAEHIGGGLRVGRVGARLMPVPASEPLEAAVLPSEDDIVAAALNLTKKAPVG